MGGGENVGGKKMEKQKPTICICIKLASVNLWVTEAGFFPRWSPVGETVLPGQINWRASAHRPHRLMKRPRGYLQGHTKEVVWMLTENWALSRMPWVASNYCRPRFQGTITERGLPYNFFFFFLGVLFISFLSRNEMIIHRLSACLVEKLSSFLSFPADPQKENLTFIQGHRTFIGSICRLQTHRKFQFETT